MEPAAGERAGAAAGVGDVCRACLRVPAADTGEEALHDYYYILQLLLDGEALDVKREGRAALCGGCARRATHSAAFLRACRRSHAALAGRARRDPDPGPACDWFGEPRLKEERCESETERWSEDETPLVLLRSEGQSEVTTLKKLLLETTTGKNKKSKKKKRHKLHRRSSRDGGVASDALDTEQTLEPELEAASAPRRGRRKGKDKKVKLEDAADEASKPRKDGRRVVETQEYVVIRLTAQQVMQEMQARAQTERYLTAPYKCEDCVKAFNYADVLQNHMEKHSPKSGLLRCELCRQHCPSAVSLRGHMKSHCTRYSCKACGCVRRSRQHLLEHHALAHAGGARCYACVHCGLTSTKRTLFQKHMRVHCPRPPLACDRCGNLFKSVESLRAHKLRHATGGAHRCAQCGRACASASALRAHRLAVHALAPGAGAGDHYCVECDVRFKSRANLTTHLNKSAKHRVAGAARHACAACPKRFWSRGALAAHAAWAHEGRREHACAHCGRAYGTRDGLRVHLRAAHAPPPLVAAAAAAARRHVCDYCTKTFKARGVLVKHLRVHTGERPYACAECGHRFAQSGTLATHVRLVHRKLPRRAPPPGPASGGAPHAPPPPHPAEADPVLA